VPNIQQRENSLIPIYTVTSVPGFIILSTTDSLKVLTLQGMILFL